MAKLYTIRGHEPPLASRLPRMPFSQRTGWSTPDAVLFAKRLAACHSADRVAFVPWWCGNEPVGWLHEERVPLVTSSGAPLAWHTTVSGERRLMLTGDDFESRSLRLAALVDRLVAAGELRPVLGESYAVVGPRGGAAVARIDRTAVAWFGVRAAGVHLSGYVATPAGLAVWVARRAAGKRSYPGHLDNLVAGGQPFGMQPVETLVKECHEEAGLPPELARRAVEVGCLRYTQQDGRSLKPDTLRCYDLELPADFRPRPVDGEVEAFDLVPVHALVESLAGDAPWKPNCALVAIDFLLRRGALDDRLPASERWALWRALRESS